MGLGLVFERDGEDGDGYVGGTWSRGGKVMEMVKFFIQF